MGNRAVIALEAMPTVGIYLHWNGSRDTVEAFLAETKRRGARSPASDTTYALARLVQTCADLATRGGSGGELLSVGVGPMEDLDTDNGDNGVYWIGGGWEITRREHEPSWGEDGESCNEAHTQQIMAHLAEIDEAREKVAS